MPAESEPGPALAWRAEPAYPPYGMLAMLRPRRGASTPLWRLLTLVVAVGQLLVVGASWLDSAAGGLDQRTHVEAAGTRLHYVHDDSTCVLCALQHLPSAPFDVRHGAVRSAPAATNPSAPDRAWFPSAHASAIRSRAPPASV